MVRKKTEKSFINEIEYIDEKKVNLVQKSMPDNYIIELLAETFNAMGDSTRVKIIFALTKEELCVSDISHLLNLTSSAVSHQLRNLRNLHLVKHRHDGKIIYYSLDDEHIESLFNEGLKHVLGG